MLSCVQFIVNPWTVTHQAPVSVGFPRQEYWSGSLCHPAGDIPDPQELACPVAPALVVKFFTIAPPGKPLMPLISLLIGLPFFIIYLVSLNIALLSSMFSSLFSIIKIH